MRKITYSLAFYQSCQQQPVKATMKCRHYHHHCLNTINLWWINCIVLEKR